MPRGADGELGDASTRIGGEPSARGIAALAPGTLFCAWYSYVG